MPSMPRIRKRYIFGGAILIAAVGYLLYMSLGSSVTYYVTVSELVHGSYQAYDVDIRVVGKVADGSINWDAEELQLEFAVAEGNATLPVIYHGVIPDGFKVDADVLVEGRYRVDDVFQASKIMMRCPSKYAPEE